MNPISYLVGIHLSAHDYAWPEVAITVDTFLPYEWNTRFRRVRLLHHQRRARNFSCSDWCRDVKFRSISGTQISRRRTESPRHPKSYTGCSWRKSSMKGVSHRRRSYREMLVVERAFFLATQRKNTAGMREKTNKPSRRRGADSANSMAALMSRKTGLVLRTPKMPSIAPTEIPP